MRPRRGYAPCPFFTRPYWAPGHLLTLILFLIHGAAMDPSADIASAVHEAAEKRPDISRREAARSGMNAGRAATGAPVWNILNYKYAASFTALAGGFLPAGRQKRQSPPEAE